eukprot:Clim_evm106s25 gene=Clim_evmTU106s25
MASGFSWYGPAVLGITALLLPLLVPTICLRLFAIVKAKREIRGGEKGLVYGFFHPNYLGGGGGERVLWAAIAGIQDQDPDGQIVIYGSGVTGANVKQLAGKALNDHVLDVFGFELTRSVRVVQLYHGWLVDPATYPVFGILGQCIGGLLLGLEAFLRDPRKIPDVFIDSVGIPYTLPLWKWGIGCKHVAAYIHYPTVNLDLVRAAEAAKGHSPTFVRNHVIGPLKMFYYRVVLVLYTICGYACDMIMVNSTWTRNHTPRAWRELKTGLNQNQPLVNIVYPPCNTERLIVGSVESKLDGQLRSRPSARDASRVNRIVSIAQFRPEKDHALQIKAFANLVIKVTDELKQRYKSKAEAEQEASMKLPELWMIGSCRNDDDRALLEDLKVLAKELVPEPYLHSHVKFKVSIPFPELKDALRTSLMGLHTMKEEHFGIGIVEMMAAGALVIAHDSGGPKEDIVTTTPEPERTGYRAKTVEEYMECLQKIMAMDPLDQSKMRIRAQESVRQRFSDATFELEFSQLCSPPEIHGDQS